MVRIRRAHPVDQRFRKATSAAAIFHDRVPLVPHHLGRPAPPSPHLIAAFAGLVIQKAIVF
jgi:hypothetical protein